MNVITVGAGHLGTQLARALRNAGHDVTVVDRDPAALEGLTGDVAHRTVHGDACDPTVLERAGAHAAAVLVAVTGEDEDNLVISLLAKRQFGVARVAARINDDDNAWQFNARWGVDVAVPAAAPLISLIEEGTAATDTVALARLTRAAVSIIETTIGDRSPAVGRPLSAIGLPPGCVVASVIRAGQPLAAGSSFVFAAGDELLLIAQNATASQIHTLFQ